jgi:hypothetical protein
MTLFVPNTSLFICTTALFRFWNGEMWARVNSYMARANSYIGVYE